MKYFFVFFGLTLILLMGIGVSPVLANPGDIFEDCIPGTGGNPNTCNAGLECDSNDKCIVGLPDDLTGPADFLNRITRVTNWIFAFFLAISFFFLFRATFQFVFEGHDPSKVAEARQSLIYAALGIVLALVSGGIDNVLRSILGA